jgi:hypothetical protein
LKRKSTRENSKIYLIMVILYGVERFLSGQKKICISHMRTIVASLLLKKLLAQSLWNKNAQHAISVVTNSNAYVTNCFKSVLYMLDTLFDLSGKIESILF